MNSSKEEIDEDVVDSGYNAHTIQSQISKLKASYQSAKLGSVKLCFDFLETTEKLIEESLSGTMSKQHALDQFIAAKMKINDQYRRRLFVSSVVLSMIDMEELTSNVIDWFQSDPHDPADFFSSNDIYYNWKNMLNIKRDLYLYEFGMKEAILQKLDASEKTQAQAQTQNISE